MDKLTPIPQYRAVAGLAQERVQAIENGDIEALAHALWTLCGRWFDAADLHRIMRNRITLNHLLSQPPEKAAWIAVAFDLHDMLMASPTMREAIRNFRSAGQIPGAPDAPSS